jgi:hypothetical protein
MIADGHWKELPDHLFNRPAARALHICERLRRQQQGGPGSPLGGR